MADSSPAFTPNFPAKAPDSDPMINRVDLESMGWQNRKSQQPAYQTKAGVQHVKNGK